MSKILRVGVACIAAALVSASAVAQDFVRGTVVRPIQTDAKVQGVRIAQPGNYRVTVGDLIELEYDYPVIPTAIPKKVESSVTTNGVVTKSKLGTRNVNKVTPTVPLIGSGTIVFYFEAQKEGDADVTLIIDQEEYVYRFKVSKE